jgi:CRISPR-associated protein Cmr1
VRPEPKLSPPPVARAEREGWVEETYELELLTPLLGGGAEPQVNDLEFPVRGGSIRGQLRFWWRATRGGKFTNRNEMQAAEKALWGSTTEPSHVQIDVKVLQKGRLSQDIRPFKDDIVPSYAAFPLTGDRDAPPRQVLFDVTFKLRIRYPEKERADVVATLWAWSTFGGLGGRSRRGFGAVGLKGQVPANPAALEAAIREGLAKHVVPGLPPRGVPSLHGARFRVGVAGGNPVDSWKKAIARYKTFRQARRPGQEPKRPGRSYWPEPDAIRRLVRQRQARHQDLEPRVDRFPRAVFGLPIIFHFQNAKDTSPNARDPRDQTLKGPDTERLASPLLIRPLRCGQTALSVAVVLTNSFHTEEGLVPGGLVLQSGGRGPVVRHAISPQEAVALQKDALKKLTPDILGSFLEHFAK